MQKQRPYLYPFPFYAVERGCTVVLYGAGSVGCDYANQVQSIQYCHVKYIVDKDYQRIKSISSIPVFPPEQLLLDDYDNIVISTVRYFDEIKEEIKEMGVQKQKIVDPTLWYMPFYSAGGEDIVVRTIFALLGREKFNYVDVGANDPYIMSNTALFYQSGCRGICVEPNPDLITALQVARAEDTVLNLGVSGDGTNETLPFYMFDDNLISTFSEIAKESHQRPIVEVRHIPVMPLAEIINRYANGLWPDFLQIDAEGLDYDILRSCDFSNSGPLVICTETPSDLTSLYQANAGINEMLGEKGYAPYCRTISNMIYLRKDIKQKILSLI